MSLSLEVITAIDYAAGKYREALEAMANVIRLIDNADQITGEHVDIAEKWMHER